MNIVICYSEEAATVWLGREGFKPLVAPDIKHLMYMPTLSPASYMRPPKIYCQEILEQKKAADANYLEKLRRTEIAKHRKRKVEGNSAVFEQFRAEVWRKTRFGRSIDEIVKSVSDEVDTGDTIFFPFDQDSAAYLFALRLGYPFAQIKILPPPFESEEKTAKQLAIASKSISFSKARHLVRIWIERSIVGWLQRHWHMERLEAQGLFSEMRYRSEYEDPKPQNDVEQYVSEVSIWYCQSIQQMLLKNGSDAWTRALERRTDSEMKQIRSEVAKYKRRKEVAREEKEKRLAAFRSFFGELLRVRKLENSLKYGEREFYFRLLLETHLDRLNSDEIVHKLIVVFPDSEAPSACLVLKALKSAIAQSAGGFPDAFCDLESRRPSLKWSIQGLSLSDQSNWQPLADFCIERIQQFEEFVSAIPGGEE